MARIDVTELFSDPDFVDKITHIRRGARVSNRGENLVVEEPFETVGCIQPTDGPTLKRLPEGLQQENLQTFWVKGPIPLTDKCEYPSILVFKGRRFQVRQVFDWTNWGPGWSEGICVAENLT